MHNRIDKSIFRLLPDGKRIGFPRSMVLLVLATSCLPYIGAAISGCLFLPGEAVGILEHYGNICFTVVFPVIFIFGLKGANCFCDFIDNINTQVIPKKLRENEKLKDFVLITETKNPYSFLKFLFIIIGSLFASFNAIKALHPIGIYGDMMSMTP